MSKEISIQFDFSTIKKKKKRKKKKHTYRVCQKSLDFLKELQIFVRKKKMKKPNTIR